MPKTSPIQPQSGPRPLGKIEILPTAVHSIVVQATCECYGVLGIASPRLRRLGYQSLIANQLPRRLLPQLRPLYDQLNTASGGGLLVVGRKTLQ